MGKIKVMTIFGTRPEAIKMAPVIKELEKRENIDSKICITGQHREMLDQALKLFSIEPDFNLDIMEKKQSITGITNKVLIGLEKIFSDYTPDIVLVHGDTTTTFGASLAAFYHQIKVGHVEAGLRTFNKYFPFPEEMNRKLTGAIADLHFAPTDNSRKNLLAEGINEDNIFVTGNTAIDAMEITVEEKYTFNEDELNKIDFKRKKVIMVTAHRRENWGEPLVNICRALKSIVNQCSDVELIYLVHLNPIVRKTVEDELGGLERVHLLNPLDTKETHNLMNLCYMIMTDSGGLQEEAPHLGKPVLVMRDVTERPEAIDAGTSLLVGTNYEKIVSEALKLILDSNTYKSMSNAVNPFGDGNASRRIVDAILNYYGME